MIRTSRPTIAALAVSCILLVGCGSAPVLGVLLPTSGSANTYGESIESGMRLALAEARERQQLPVGFEVYWADTGSDPDRAVQELRTMVSEHDVKLVLGGATSAEAKAMVPVLDELEVVCLSPSASAPGLAATSRHLYRLYPSDELEGDTAGRFLFDRLGKEKVVLYVGDSEYTRGIEPEFRKRFEQTLGGTVAGRVELTSDDWRERSRTALRACGCDAVYVIAYAEPTLEVLRHLREIGFNGRVVTTSAFYSSRVVQEAGELAEDVMFPLPPFDRTSEKEPVLGFVTRYMDTYQRAPDVFAAHGYDAMRLAVHILELASPPETPEIRKALSFGVTEFTGVTGPILFDDYGDVKHYPKMFIVHQDQVLSYQRYMQAERQRILRQVQELLVVGPTPTPSAGGGAR
jgi:branched-chain amino acid transport system substrate-binding protein